MASLELLRKSFDEFAWRLPFDAVPVIGEAGLVLGFGTVLARMGYNRLGESMLTLELDEERVLALLSAVYGRQVSPGAMHYVRRASEQWRCGDKVLAHFELAFARFPRLEGHEDAFRLFLAENLLSNGFTPHRLTKELGFDPQLLRYNPDQPRVPAGSGRTSGEWEAASGSAPAVSKPSDARVRLASLTPIAVSASAEAGTLVSGLFATEEGTEFLAGLASLIASGTIGAIGAGVFLGALTIPFNTQTVLEGTVPGDPDLHYTFYPYDQLTAEFWRQGPSGRETLFTAMAVGDILYESETGIPIARKVGNTLVMDAESLASVAELGRSETGAVADSESRSEQPQLCPDPGPDAPHGASQRAKDYQAYISWLNNPQRPLPPGIAVSLPDPATGRRVVYDDCREADGTMIEAKGQGYANLLRSEYMQDVLATRWRTQGERQVRAAGWRGNDWFFAEDEAADFARKLFLRIGLGKIEVIPEPMGAVK